MIIVQPASMAGATLLIISMLGAFQGMIAPTTPTGSRTSSAFWPNAEVCGSSKAKVSASFAWARRTAAPLVAVWAVIECSVPDSMVHESARASALVA